MRTVVWYLVSIATIISAVLQALTFFNIVPVQTIEASGLLPPGVAEKIFLKPYNAGVDHLVNGEYSDAIEEYKRALNTPGLTPAEKARAYNAIGYAYFKMGEYAKADEALQQALTLNPKAPLAHVNLIKVMCARKDAPAEVQAALRYLRSFAPGYGHDEELMSACAYAGITPDFN